MRDLINRSDALIKCYELKEVRRKWGTKRGQAEISGIDAVMCALHNLPAEQQQVRKGKWNTYYHGDNTFSYSCNMCGYSSPYDLYHGEYSQKKWRFCPNCGAEMRGDNT